MLSGHHRGSQQDDVVYGRAAADALGQLAATYGCARLLVVSTRSLAAQAHALAEQLGTRVVGVFTEVGAHSPRPDVIAGAARARSLGADLLVALGGGSVIDATKVMQLCLWGALTRPEQLDAYRRGAPTIADLKPGVRMIALPTTLSAAEFTPLAGVTDPVRRAKEGYAHPFLVPRGVVLDPALTLDTPASLWFSTGLKAVDHAIEQLCHPQRAPYADALAAEGLRRLGRGLRATRADATDREARLDCQFGMWLAIAGASTGRGMGASHAIGHTLGGSFGVPHGFTSCVALPAVLQYNAQACPTQQALVSALLDMPEHGAAEAVRALCADLELPTDLESVGIDASKLPEIAARTMHDPGVRANPRPIREAADIVAILRLALRNPH